MQERPVELLGVPSRRYVPYHWRCTVSASEFNGRTSALTVLVDVVDTESVWIGNELGLAYAVHDPEPYAQIHDTADCKRSVCYSIFDIRRRRLQLERSCRAGRWSVAIEGLGVALKDGTVFWCSAENSSQNGQHDVNCRPRELRGETIRDAFKGKSKKRLKVTARICVGPNSVLPATRACDLCFESAISITTVYLCHTRVTTPKLLATSNMLLAQCTSSVI